jgi:ATP-binding cassette subfamily B (MDR/TAP) protein 1
VSLGFLPIIVFTGAIQMALRVGFSDQTDAAYKDSSNIIMEAITNIRTVISVGY